MKWRGWGEETPERRGYFLGAIAVVVIVAGVATIGGLGTGGLNDPWLWVGVALVPLLLWLVRKAGLR